MERALHLGEKTPSADAVSGVRINCEGDTKIGGRPAIEASLVNPTKFFAQERSRDIPASRAIGIPLLVHAISEAPLWRGRHIRDTCIPYCTNFHWPAFNPVQAWISTGTVLLVGEDRKLLRPAHVRALGMFLGEQQPEGRAGKTRQDM